MGKFERLLTDSRKDSLYGQKAKRELKFLLFAIIMCVGISALCFASDTTAGDVSGVVMATTAALAVPKKTRKEVIAEKRLQLQKNLTKHMKALDEEGQAMLQTIMDEIDSIYSMADEEGTGELITALQSKIEALQQAQPTEQAAAAAAEEMKQLKQTVADIRLGGYGGGENIKSFKAQLKTFMGSDEFKSAMQEKREISLSVKAVGPILAGTNIGTGGSTGISHALSFEIIPGIQSNPKETNAVFPTLLKGSTSSRVIIWINRMDKEGGSAFIVEGDLKPLKDWEYSEEKSIARKVAVSCKVSREMLDDFEYMESEIRMLLEQDLFNVVDNMLLNGTGGNDLGFEPKGVINNSSPYVGTGLDGTVTSPTNPDAIRAAILQIRLLNYKPDVVFLNPTDVAAIDLIKTSDGHYIKVETDSIMQNIRVVETTEVAAGSFLILDTTKQMVRVLSDYEIQFGWENDDFRKNLVTVIAEMRLHTYSNTIDLGSSIYASFATVKTALAVPAA